MTAVLVFTVAAAVVVAVVLGFLRLEGRFAGRRDELLPLDCAAFARLLDETDEQIIRRHLAPKEYAMARQKRVRAAIAYTQRVRANAAALIQMGELARKDPVPGSARAADEVIQLAVRLRAETLAALLWFRLALLWPSLPLRYTSLAAGWADLQRRNFAPAQQA